MSRIKQIDVPRLQSTAIADFLCDSGIEISQVRQPRTGLIATLYFTKTYEKEHIQNWITKYNTCPTTAS